MKRILLGTLIMSTILIACSKSDDPAPVPDSYMNFTAGSSWNYQFTDNITPANSGTYTLTSTTRDTTAGSRSYHVFENNNGPNEYYNITANDYYSFQALSDVLGGDKIESLYLKSDLAVNATWSEVITVNNPAIGFPINLNVTHKIKEKGMSKTVNGISYDNVIHVETNIAAPAPFTSALTTSIDRFYAPKKGLIQSDTKIDLVYPAAGLDEHVDTQTRLLSATIL